MIIYFLLAGVGVLTGVLIGFTGASGMSILISCLLLLKFGIREIIGLTFVVTLVNSVAAIIPYVRKPDIHLSKSFFIAVPAFFSVWLGNKLSGIMSAESLAGIIIISLFIGGMKFLLSKRKEVSHHKKALRKRKILALLILGVLIGTIMGVMGGGGGIFITALLLNVFKFPVKEAIAASIIVMGASSLSGVYINYVSGNVNFLVALIIIVPSMICSYYSSRVAVKVDSHLTKKILGGYLVIISIILFVKTIAGT